MSSSGALSIQPMAAEMRFALKEQNSYVSLSFRTPYRIALYILWLPVGDDKSSSALVLPQFVQGLESTAIKAP